MQKLRRTDGRAEKGTPKTGSNFEEIEAIAPPPGQFAPSRAQLRLLQACLTHRTIDSDTLGDLLCLSPETVRTHFKTLRREMGLHERLALLLYALEAGLITLPWVPQGVAL